MLVTNWWKSFIVSHIPRKQKLRTGKIYCILLYKALEQVIFAFETLSINHSQFLTFHLTLVYILRTNNDFKYLWPLKFFAGLISTWVASNTSISTLKILESRSFNLYQIMNFQCNVKWKKKFYKKVKLYALIH